MKPSTHQLINLIFLVVLILGVLANFLVITSNGGKMPVYTLEYEWKSDTHFTYTNNAEVEYPYLADIFKVGSKMWSLGDFMMSIGFFCLSVGNLTLMIKLIKIDDWYE